MSDPRTSRRFDASVLATCIAAFVLVAIAFLPRLRGDFVWDDAYLVRDNASLRSLAGLRTILTRDLWGSATGHGTQLFHPVPMLTLWAQYQLTGLSIVAFRIVDVALHCACAAALFALARARAIPFAAAALGAGVFLVHPSVTEPVLWITGRHDTIGLLFTLLAALSLPRAVARPSWIAVPAVCVALAFLSKEQFVVAPVLIALAAPAPFWTEVRARSPRAIAAALLPVVSAALVLAWRHALGIASGSDALAARLVTHLRNAATIASHYFVQLATFSNGSTIETYEPLSARATFIVIAVIGLGLALLVLLARRTGRIAAGVWVGCAWFLVALAPHVVSIPMLHLFANRYGYTPLAGLSLALAHGLEPIVSRIETTFARRTALALASAVLLALAVRTSIEGSYWRTDLALYRRDVERRPDDGRALYHYATALQRHEGCVAAEPVFVRATERAPDDARSWHNLAGCRLRLGRFADAVSPAMHAVALERDDPRNWFNLGVALRASGDDRRGRRALEHALRLDPHYAAAREALAASALR
jgi:hypothetical protein